MAFITAEELKNMPLPVTDKQWEKLETVSPYQTEFAINTATEHVKNFLERDIEETDYVERIRGFSRPTIMVNNYPIMAITSLTGTNIYGNVTTYSVGGFIVDADAGIIEWADKYRNEFRKDWIYTVSYTAGIDPIPYVVKQATALQALNILSPLFRGGQNFAQVDLVESLDEQTVDLLERYQRRRIG